MTNPPSVSPVVNTLQSIEQSLSTLLSAFGDDALAMIVNSNLLNDIWSGHQLTTLEQQIEQYIANLNRIVGRCTQVRDATRQFWQNIDSAGSALRYPPLISQKGNWVMGQFNNISSNQAFAGSGYYYVEGLISSAPTFPEPPDPYPGPDINAFPDEDKSAIRGVLDPWFDAIESAKLTWHSQVYGMDAEQLQPPSITGITPDPATIQSITNQLIGVSQIIKPLTAQMFVSPDEYNQIVSTFPDPRTQALMFNLLRSPTGQQFVQYYLYMGKKLGPDFISWQDLSKDGAGAESTDGGCIIMNLDDSSATTTDYDQLSAVLVHEGIESYFSGAKGIRQMATVHADYVAEWYDGKIMAELGHPPPNQKPPQYLGAYGQSYQTWVGGPDGQSYLSTESENVDLTNIDSPGHYYTPDGKTDVHLNPADIPNPMGLDPHMLTTGDLHQFDKNAPVYTPPKS